MCGLGCQALCAVGNSRDPVPQSVSTSALQSDSDPTPTPYTINRAADPDDHIAFPPPPPQLIVKAKDYPSAVQKMKGALEEFAVRGVKTNIPFLINVFKHPDFMGGAVTTKSIEENPSLFEFQDTHGEMRGSKILNYLAETVRGRGACGGGPALAGCWGLR